MKNKVKVLVIIIVLLLVVLGIYIFSNKEKMYENVRIISEDPSCGIPSRIIYNNKEYEISEEDDISSVKYYNGKIYYYKSIGEIDIYSYMQSVNDIENINNIFYEFGEIILNEENLTYIIKVEKQISYAEYENRNKERIEYCIKNIKGEYGLEIDETYEMRKYGDIIVEGIEKEDGSIATRYTKKDKANNIIWSYETKSEIPAQCSFIGELEVTEDRIYLYEFGKIIVLNKEDGKIIWRQDDYTGNRFSSWYLDEEYNLYLIGTNPGMFCLIDRDGNIKVKIENESLSEIMLGDGFRLDLANEKYLLFEGWDRNILIYFNDYSVIIEDRNEEMGEGENFVLKKLDKKSNIIWKYEKNNKGGNWIETEIIENRIYINAKGTITVLDTETGKMLWEKEICDIGDEHYFITMRLDEQENLYLTNYNTNTLHIIDKDGNKKSEIKHTVICDTGPEGYFHFHFIDKNELLICNDAGILNLNLEDYSIKYSIESNDEKILTIDNKHNIISESKIKESFSQVGCIECVACVNNKLYINLSGTIVAIDVETGKVIWQNSDYAGGAHSRSCFDNTGNLYISSGYDVSGVKKGPDLHIIDKNGKTLKRIERFDNEDGCPTEKLELRNNENELVVSYGAESAYIINLKDYSVKQENIEE